MDSMPPATQSHTGQTRTLDVTWLGRVPYDESLDLQARLVAERRGGSIADQLLLLEHPHVITMGTSAREDHVLLDDRERDLLGIELFDTGRGGDVTYHGPGQLVGYPILDLKPDRCDLHRYVRDLEEVLMRAALDFDVATTRVQGQTGVWAGNEKIAAIGVRVSSGWITSHGFALNVNTDLRYFDSIVPCGIRDRGVTSMAALLRRDVDRALVAERIVHHFGNVFERATVGRKPTEIFANGTRKT